MDVTILSKSSTISRLRYGVYFNYTYDNLGNISEEKEDSVSQASYTYDSMNLLTIEKLPVQNCTYIYTYVYTYDPYSNIRTKASYTFT